MKLRTFSDLGSEEDEVFVPVSKKGPENDNSSIGEIAEISQE
jgi:hypothetical protein